MKKEFIQKQILDFEKRFSNIENRVMLLDGSNHFIINMVKNYGVLSNSNNEDTGGLYASINKFFIEYYSIKPDYLIVTFDLGGSTKHKKLNKDYKSNRHISFRNQFTTEKEYVEYIENSKRELSSFKKFLSCFPKTLLIEIPNVEGDFLLAKSKEIIDSNMDGDNLFYFVTTDKDFYQLLIDPRVAILNPITGKLITQSNYTDFIDVRLDQITLSRAIIGDSSDNIKGIKGIGKKTTEKIMKYINKTYCNVSEFLNEVEKIPNIPKKEILLTSKELLESNWKLFNLLDVDCMLSLQTIIELENDIHKLINSKNEMQLTAFYEILEYENISTVNINKIVSYLKKKYHNIRFMDKNGGEINRFSINKYVNPYIKNGMDDDEFKINQNKENLANVTMQKIVIDEDFEDF